MNSELHKNASLVVYKATENNKHKGVSKDKCPFEKQREILIAVAISTRTKIYLMLKLFHYKSHWFCLLRVYILAITANK